MNVINYCHVISTILLEAVIIRYDYSDQRSDEIFTYHSTVKSLGPIDAYIRP